MQQNTHTHTHSNSINKLDNKLLSYHYHNIIGKQSRQYLGLTTGDSWKRTRFSEDWNLFIHYYYLLLIILLNVKEMNGCICG